MTSMIPPSLYAAQMATKAQASLHTASATLNGPRPMHEPIGRERGLYNVAAGHAREAIASIDSAMSYGSSFLAKDVVNAFGRAKEQAQAGVLQLTSMTTRPVDTDDVVLKFDGAGMWLGLAKNLMELYDGRPNRPLPPVMPPVTILPVDPPVGPGEPGSPITIQPIMPGHPQPTEPITIQLPSPDSPIQ